MRAQAALLTVIPLLAALAACAPVTVEQAEASCQRDAERSAYPRGELSVGVMGGSGGASVRTRGEIELGVSTNPSGRDPSDEFNRCVLRRSGEMPTRSLYDLPGWRG
ncbi:hypothetical protein [Paracoccus marinaquae]|uniref:Lipoprotein n=1 Tax=Paracoccus marinaquae TaxID=2841926 RepID=A0ABS6AJ89_9RHOB|nr:hypothetical protein [Paracoccus marinaquae]MBU3029962.1 hypothetical protein [Paracoccus marinaquae]